MTDDTSAADFTEAESSRLDKIEQQQERQGGQLEQIMSTLAKLVPGSHAEAQQRTEDRLDRPTAIAEIVRAELDGRAKAAADAKAADEAKSNADELARLREKAPEAPERWAEKFMGWRSA